MGTGVTAKDCLAVARMFITCCSPDDALVWVERGLELCKKTRHGAMEDYDLKRLRREILTVLGRGNEALEDAWVEYCRKPCMPAYEDLMKLVPDSDRLKWHDKAIDATENADFDSLFELLTKTGELDYLSELIRRSTDADLERLSHYITEPAAEVVENSRPDVAARLWRAQGMRIVNAKKSKYYNAALLNFERSKRCYERAGLSGEWKKIVIQVRSVHRRKSGFISGFERIVAGMGNRQSFVERARERWIKQSE
jgi:hypothetical protein